jgi:hypothetical protein
MVHHPLILQFLRTLFHLSHFHNNNKKCPPLEQPTVPPFALLLLPFASPKLINFSHQTILADPLIRRLYNQRRLLNLPRLLLHLLQ